MLQRWKPKTHQCNLSFDYIKQSEVALSVKAQSISHQTAGHHLLEPLGLGLIVEINTSHQLITWRYRGCWVTHAGLIHHHGYGLISFPGWEVCWSCTDRPAWISCALSWCPPRSYCSVWSPAAGFLNPDPSAGLQALSVPDEEHENMRDEMSMMCFGCSEASAVACWVLTVQWCEQLRK